MPSGLTTGPSLGRGSPAMREMEPKDQQLMVALRIRPLSDTELEEGATVIAHKVGDQMVVLMDPGEDPEDTLRTHRSREKTFIFDTVFDQHASQEDVYRATTQHLVEGVVSGYNATVFAYGPSGAGKTYTMLGMDAEPGIYLQTLADLFRAIEEIRDSADCSVSMSYLEIYNEVIRDLLNPSSGFLDLREDSRGSIQIAGIMEVSTSNAQEIMQLLTKGNRQRTQEPTATNKTSSRSHAVLQVTVRQRSRGPDLVEEVRVGKLFMVDLAGSERASQTQNRGKRMKEGAHINRSLLALGNCINALSEKGGSRAQYVNFRDSKLTRLLKDALGGNSRTVMIAHISPASTYFEESRTTLLYAYRAKNIKTRVKRNLLNVSYRIAQYTDVISDLRREIEHLKSKIEKQEGEKRVMIPPSDGEEDSRLQMNKIRAQLIGAFKEQLEMRRSLVELENTNIELHVDTSRHLLTIADWEREKTHQHAHRERTSERDEEPAEADADGDEGESVEPHEVALAREEVNMLLAEQRKTAALKAGLEQRLANAKKKASQLEKLLPTQVISEDQREVLRLLCRAHELEVENTELQANNLCRRNLMCQKDFVIQRYHQHRLLCEQLIQDQWQLIQGVGIAVPESLARRRCLYSRELGAGSLNRLLLLHAVMSSSLRDGSVLNTSPPPPEEASRDQLDDRKDLPWGAQFELPPMLLETDSGYRSSQGTPSKTLGKQDSLLPPPSLRILLTPPSHEQSSSLSVKNLVSKLCSPTGRDLGASQVAAEAGGLALSAQALKEMAVSTKSIALIAATRRSKAQDREGGGGRSSIRLLEEVAPDSRAPKASVTPDPSPADRRWLLASPGRDCSTERKARRKRSPSLTWSVQTAAEHGAESQPSPAVLQLTKSSGKSFFPPVPAASKIKPSLSSHTDEKMLQMPEVSFTFPSATWQSSPGPSRAPLLPRDIRGSTDSGGRHHSPLPPSTPRKPRGSGKRPRRPQ
ncbi:kinesin-like protein KIF19 isoform X1 [Canis lupus familiaris]|uniref:kinesin-like protein KIF19 isoform X1 n=1 Tax=Canis lupus familiaris TaxID=9615 RepID=UPI0018F3BE2C|nr:kinesin-like protein KIF19 isoform X1 [Canis lupus familiaris]